MQLPRSSYRHVSYKKREVPIYYAMEEKLMDKLGTDYSGLHKLAVRELHNNVMSKELQLA